MYVEFFGQTGGGKSTIVHAAQELLKGKCEQITRKRALIMRPDPLLLLRTVRKSIEMLRVMHTHGNRHWAFFFAFLPNWYAKEYCASRNVLFLNDHGFMMALLDTFSWHRLKGYDFTLSVGFMRDYLDLVHYRPEDVVVLVDVSTRTALQRESVRKKYHFTDEQLVILYSACEEAIPLVRGHIFPYVLKNVNQDKAVHELLRVVESAMHLGGR